MKTVALALLILAPFSVAAQDLFASNEPIAFYTQINTSLSDDDPEDAIQHFKKVIAFYKQQGREAELPESYFGMALALALNGYYKESIRYHKRAIRSHKKVHHHDALEMNINLGLTYELAGKYKKARRILGEAETGS